MRYGDEQWAKTRAFCEGRPRTYAYASELFGIPAPTIRERAVREGWIKIDCRTRAGRRDRVEKAPAAPVALADPPDGWEDMAPEQRLEWLNGFVARQVAQIAASAEGEGGALDKVRIDALAAMLRMLEKSETFAKERTEIRVQDDAELAEKLRLIDERIVELAAALAGRMAFAGGPVLAKGMGGAADRGALG